MQIFNSNIFISIHNTHRRARTHTFVAYKTNPKVIVWRKVLLPGWNQLLRLLWRWHRQNQPNRTRKVHKFSIVIWKKINFYRSTFFFYSRGEGKTREWKRAQCLKMRNYLSLLISIALTKYESQPGNNKQFRKIYARTIESAFKQIQRRNHENCARVCISTAHTMI